jgi:beta-lactamase class A
VNKENLLFNHEENPKNNDFPKRNFPVRFKPLPAPNKGGEKWIGILFFGSILLSIFLWVGGNLKNNSFKFNLPKNSEKITPTLSATPTPKQDQTVVIKNEIENLIKNLKGRYGVSVYNLTTKEGFGLKENDVFTAASINKLPVILTLYLQAEAGKIDLDSKYTLEAIDKRTGAGSIQSQKVGTIYTYRKLAELMGQQSDNTAFAALRRILTDQKIQSVIDSLGMSHTSLVNSETSPGDVNLFFRKLYSGSILKRENRDEILTFLTKTIYETRIPAGVPLDIKVAHKIGSDIGVVGDAGIVFAPKPYILVILSGEVLEGEANLVLPKISKSVWDFENK